MSIILPGQLSHSNPDFAIADIKDVRGGIRSIDILDNASLASFSNEVDKFLNSHSIMIEKSSNRLFRLKSGSPLDENNWELVSTVFNGLEVSRTNLNPYSDNIDLVTQINNLPTFTVEDNVIKIFSGLLQSTSTGNFIQKHFLVSQDNTFGLSGSQITYNNLELFYQQDLTGLSSSSIISVINPNAINYDLGIQSTNDIAAIVNSSGPYIVSGEDVYFSFLTSNNSYIYRFLITASGSYGLSASGVTQSDFLGFYNSPIIASQFKKKSESIGYTDPMLSGSNAVIQFRSNGESVYAFSNTGLVSIDGFGLDLITGNPYAEAPYTGKDILIYNNKATDLILKHDGAAQCKFFFIDETDLIIPPGGKVWLKYGSSYCEMIFKSWNVKVDVGLGNVDNTSDINKPISTLTQTALNLKEDLSNKATDFTIINDDLYPSVEAAKEQLDLKLDMNLSIKNQAGVTHTITLEDVKNKLIVFDSSSDVVLTIPSNSFLPLEIGTNFSVLNKGTGAMTTQGAAGVTIRTKNVTPAVSNDVRRYVKLSENEWLEDTDFEQLKFVPLSVYLDIINGNDSTAKIEDSKKPFKTMAALISSLPATTGETYTIYISGGTVPITRKMPIRNLNFVAYSATTLDFTNCKENDGVTEALFTLSLFGTTIFNALSTAPNWNFSGSNISVVCNYVGGKMFAHPEISGSWNQVGLALTGTLNKLDWRSTSQTTGRSFYIKTANLLINELYDSTQVRPHFMFTGLGNINYPATITIRKWIVSNRNAMCSYVTGNAGFSVSMVIENINETVTNAIGLVINSSYAKIGNVTMNGRLNPQSPTLEFNGTLSSGCTVDLIKVSLIRGTLNSTTYCDTSWGGHQVVFENFTGKLRNLLAVATSNYVFRNCILNLNGLLVSNFNSSVNNLIQFEGINTINQLDANASLVTTSYNCTVSIKGVLTTNMTSLGQNITSVYQTATFKEKLQEIVIRSKKDLVNRTLSSTTTYVVDGTLILASGEYIEIPPGGLTLTGYGFDVSRVQKNVSGQSMFKSPIGGSGNLVSKDIEYNSGVGSVFDITDSDGSHAIEFNDVNFVGCNSIGLINGYRQFTGTTCGIYGCASGFVLDGTWNGFKMVNTNAFSFGATGKLFSAGATLTFSNRFFIELNLSLPIGAVITDFTDANFLNNKLLQVTNCFIKVNGVIDPDYTPVLFPGITPNSMKSYFVNNIGLRNTPIEPYSMRGSNFRVCDDDLEASSQDVAVGEFYIEAATGYLKQRLT